jgi:NADH-quinone oxidoreductase subunit N
LFGLSPILVVAVGALLLMLAEALGGPSRAVAAQSGAQSTDIDPFDAGSGRASELGLGAAVVLFVGAVFALSVWLVGPENLSGLEKVKPWLIIDRQSVFIAFALCLSGALSSLLAGGYMTEHGIDRSELFQLVLLSTVGAIVLAAAGDLLTIFLALETMSLGVYCMVGLRRTARSLEASIKYFLLGSFASALTLMGMALLFGATGHTDLEAIGQAISTVGGGAVGGGDAKVPAATIVVSLVLMLAGFGFKVAAVPFHMWTPDAYEGAPTPVTAYMAGAVKTAAFAVLLRVLLIGFGDERLTSWGTGWPPALATLAVVTMVVANVIAGRQDSIKRMLAYSSIAHAGYVLVGVVATMRSESAQSSVLFYLLAYAVSTIGAFGTLILCGRKGAEAVSYEDLAGLGRRHPAAALAFSVFLLSLAGIPPLAGFFGKLYVFQAAIDAELYGLAVIGLLNSVVGAYYYLRVMVFMYMREPAPGAPVAVPMRSGLVNAALIIAAVLVVWWGMNPIALSSIIPVAALP